MANRLNLENMEFGLLKALRIIGKDSHGNILWECKCSCGNTKNVGATYLKKGTVRSCGCLSYFTEIMNGFLSNVLLEENYYHGFTVLKKNLKKSCISNFDNGFFFCLCNCGNYFESKGGELKRRKGCGRCYANEINKTIIEKLEHEY